MTSAAAVPPSPAAGGKRGAAASPGTLRLAGVHVRFGGVSALAGVSFTIEPGHVGGLIGPNGAGKTTLINAVTGIVRPTSGSVHLGALRLDRLPPHRIARDAAVARTYQNIRLFGALTIRENLRAGAYRLRRTLADLECRALLDRVGVAAPLDAVASSLPYGDQRRLEIARALALEPRLLLLDEPAAGMNPRERNDLGRLIREIGSGGPAVLLVEHDVGLVSAVCDRIVVLNFGTVIAEGTPAQVRRDPTVIEAYLGQEEG